MPAKIYQLTEEQQKTFRSEFEERLRANGFKLEVMESSVESGEQYLCPACGGEGIYEYPDDEGFLHNEECGCCAGVGLVWVPDKEGGDVA